VEKCEQLPGAIFVCHYGLERSRAAAEAFNDIGLAVGHFIGGTNAIAELPVEEIKKRIPLTSKVFLIYDQGSKENEFQDKENAADKLKLAGIDYGVIDTPALTIMLFECGKNINDYLY
jgi:hypothetical protein